MTTDDVAQLAADIRKHVEQYDFSNDSHYSDLPEELAAHLVAAGWRNPHGRTEMTTSKDVEWLAAEMEAHADSMPQIVARAGFTCSINSWGWEDLARHLFKSGLATRASFVAELRAVAVCPCTDPNCTRREAIEMAAKVLEARR